MRIIIRKNGDDETEEIKLEKMEMKEVNDRNKGHQNILVFKGGDNNTHVGLVICECEINGHIKEFMDFKKHLKGASYIG